MTRNTLARKYIIIRNIYFNIIKYIIRVKKKYYYSKNTVCYTSQFIRRKYFMQITYTIANGVYLSTRSVELFASPIIIIIIIWSQYTGKSGTQTSHLSRRPDVYIENRINHNLLGINYIYVRRVCIAKSIILSMALMT